MIDLIRRLSFVVLLLASAVFHSIPAKAAEEIRADAKITKVTVYSDRALVTRTAVVSVRPGEVRILFTQLPSRFEKNSIQVTGTGHAVLKDVTFETVHLPDVVDARQKALLDEKQAIKEAIQFQDDAIIVAVNEQKFVENIAGKLTGVDNGIEVVRKLVKKHESEKGVFEKNTTRVDSYLIKIANHKRAPMELVLWDQLPISTHESIEVTLLDPAMEKNVENPKMNEHRFLEWLLHLDPEQEMTITFSFSVEFPVGVTITGLD